VSIEVLMFIFCGPFSLRVLFRSDLFIRRLFLVVFQVGEGGWGTCHSTRILTKAPRRQLST